MLPTAAGPIRELRPRTQTNQDTVTPERHASTPVTTLYLFAFLSGMAALVYEVAWTKMLTLTFGRTTLAASAVVGGFMAGMGIGAWLYHRAQGGRLNAIRLYASLEIGIALTTALLTLGFSALPNLFVAVSGAIPAGLPMSLFRVGFVLVILLLPAALMGATYPALCAVLIRTREDAGRHLGPIYGLNTIGAAIGALIAGFVLVEQLGLRGSVWAANLINLGVGAAAWQVGRSASSDAYRPATLNDANALLPTYLPRRITAVVLFGSGFATLAYEIVWFRALRYLFGNSTYAFTIMLVVFLLGLGLGGNPLWPRALALVPGTQPRGLSAGDRGAGDDRHDCRDPRTRRSTAQLFDQHLFRGRTQPSLVAAPADRPSRRPRAAPPRHSPDGILLPPRDASLSRRLAPGREARGQLLPACQSWSHQRSRRGGPPDPPASRNHQWNPRDRCVECPAGISCLVAASVGREAPPCLVPRDPGGALVDISDTPGPASVPHHPTIRISTDGAAVRRGGRHRHGAGVGRPGSPRAALDLSGWDADRGDAGASADPSTASSFSSRTCPWPSIPKSEVPSTSVWDLPPRCTPWPPTPPFGSSMWSRSAVQWRAEVVSSMNPRCSRIPAFASSSRTSRTTCCRERNATT